MANDEQHWREMTDRDAMRAEVDRLGFSRLSSQLRNLDPGTIDVLVDHVVSAREQGREEGRVAAAQAFGGIS